MLTAGGEAAYISEPLNVLHRPGVLRAPVEHWYTLISSENENAFLPAFRETLAYRYHLTSELSSLRNFKDLGRMGRDLAIFTKGKLKHQRPLLKDPFAVFSAPWFAERLDCQVVITVRHPAAFVSSLKRLGWNFDFNDLVAQPVLMETYLTPFQADIEQAVQRPPDVIVGASLLWHLIYSVVHQYRAEHPDFVIIRHEDLSLDPLNGFQALHAQLGLEFNRLAQQAVQRSSSSENPGELSTRSAYRVNLDSRSSLQNWKRRLSTDEIDQVRTLTEEAALYFYPDFTWD
jgi:hypothetical protein